MFYLFLWIKSQPQIAGSSFDTQNKASSYKSLCTITEVLFSFGLAFLGSVFGYLMKANDNLGH